ncbi:MAG: phosphatase PAP2 family protein, partial [Kineosporiaceae bacterium]|nr:phosphatase PAP2 family protein [Aeromicrobium sp.]
MSPTRDRLVARLVAGATMVVSAGAGWATYRLAVSNGPGQRLDHDAMDTVYAGPDARLAVLRVLSNVSIGAVVVVMLLCVGLALARGHSQWAIGAVVVIAGANVTTQLLKRVVLDRPDFNLGILNSLPSGHTTVVASATAAMVLTAPPALRAVMILGGSAATTLTAASAIVAGWHRPSRVVAALAVTLLWAAAASAMLSRRVVHTRGATSAAMIGAAGGVIVLVVLGVGPTTGGDGFGGAALVLSGVAAL